MIPTPPAELAVLEELEVIGIDCTRILPSTILQPRVVCLVVERRERMIGQGEQRLDQDTGVANAPGQGGVNAASNY